MTTTCSSPVRTESLEAAGAIGERLSRDAVWYRGRCNWIGVASADLPGEVLAGGTYRALGPEVYGGTSGVALFLAELYAATGHAGVRRSALGATRHALTHRGAVSPPKRLGLYSGWTGIALVAARVGGLLGDEALLRQAARVLRAGGRKTLQGSGFDVVSGKAGAIAALVTMHALLPDNALVDLAVRLGEDLLRTAQTAGAGNSWPAPDAPTRLHPTGYAHGAAGVGHALLELFRLTSDERFRRAAALAFEYERRWFDIGAGNWPDLRGVTRRRTGHSQGLPLPTAWCQGAPGIALSRLRAYELVGDERCKEEAVTALRTTQRAVETSLHTGAGDFSLCHGLAGNSEVLLYGEHVLGDAGDDGVPLVARVAGAGIERHIQTGSAWPCGTPAGEPPGLMLGLAGIGRFYLRLFDPSIPSLLIVHPERGWLRPPRSAPPSPTVAARECAG